MSADLEFRIGAELTEIKAALNTLQRDIQRTGNVAKGAGDGAFKGVETGAKGALAALGPLALALSSVAALFGAIGQADKLNSLNARLKLTTDSTDELVRAQTALFDLAQRSRSDFGETVRLFTQLANATADANVGQETLLQITETINQAVQLSGASAQAAEAALVQFGQGLASGTLRGEELNSILEQTPPLADAIAKGMGITRGELRKYGEEGKITGEKVITALQNQRGEIQRQFDALPVTVGQAVTLLKNAGLQILGVFDQASGATAGLAGAIKDLADFLSSDSVLGAIAEFTTAWREGFELIGQDLDALGDIFEREFAAIGSGAETLSALVARAFRELPVNIRTSIQIVTVQAAAMFDRLVSYAQFVKDNFKAIFTDDTQDASFRRFQQRNSAIAQASEDSIGAALAEREAALAAARAAREQAQATREQGRRNTGANSRGTFRPAGPTSAEASKAAALRKAELDAEEKLANDSAKRQLDALKQLFDDSQIAAADYYRRREALELASVDRSIATERERAKAGGAEQKKALAEIEILEREKVAIRERAARDQAEFERRLAEQLQQARIRQLEADGQTVEAAKLKAEAQYRDLIARLQSEGDAAGVALIRKLIGSEVADAELQALRAKIDSALGDLRDQESLIAAQADAGLLPALEAERQLQELRARSLEQLQAYREALIAVANAQTQAGGVADPRVVEMIRRTDTEIARITASQKALQNQIQDAGRSAIGGFFTDLATNARSFGDAVKAAAVAFVQSLARMAAEALAKRAILALGQSGAGGGLFGALASVLVAHSGAMVGGGGGWQRAVNPAIFAGAPRYHNGSGVLGLAPDERPAILQTGEEVLSRTDPRNAKNGGGGGGSGYRIMNVLDPSLVSNYLESAAGERTIMNVIGGNPSQVRQLIGV